MGMLKRKKKTEEQTGLEPGAELPRKLTPMDIQERIFRTEMRGYNKQEVDVFLDQVTEELGKVHEENRRLREGTAAGADLAEARAEAEEIKRKARAEADSIKSSGPVAARGPAGDATGAVSAFLTREKQFLQGLAEAISGHAESVKEIAKGTRSQTKPAPPTPDPPKAPAQPAAEPAPLPPAPAPIAEPVVNVTVPPPATGKSIISIAGVDKDGPSADNPNSARETAPEPVATDAGNPMPFKGDNDKERRDEREQDTATVPPRDRSLRELFWGEE